MKAKLVEKITVSETVGASSTVLATLRHGHRIRNIRAQYATKGANTTGKIQASIDGTTFEDIQTMAAGFNAALTPRASVVRVELANAGGSGEANVVALVVEYDIDVDVALRPNETGSYDVS